MDNSYMDYLSTLDRQESGEGIKDLFKDHFDIIRPLLNDVYWVDAFTAYLNYTCGVSQTKIGKLVNMSQLGVSRRARSCIKKLSLHLEKPEKNSDKVKKDLAIIFDESFIEPLALYYFISSFSLINRITGNVFFRNKIISAKEYMDKLQSCKNKKDFIKALKYNKKEIIKRIEKGGFERLYAMVVRYNTYFGTLLKTNTYSHYQSKLYDDKRTTNAKIQGE